MITSIKQYLYLILLSWGIKFLLIPAYYSTDFQVHQNWLRITNNEPLSQWYYDNQSKWTLDYPPIFAYFQCILAKIAYFLVSQSIVSTINTLTITLYYQRITVIITDLVYLLVLLKFFQWKINMKLILLYFFIPFLMLDNIHFQYNLLLQALFIYSIDLMLHERFLMSAFMYSLLLNSKHIYLYCAPAFFIYLLTRYVLLLGKQQSFKDKLFRLIKLGTATLIPFVISFLPFLLSGGIQGIKQIFSRLFPFGRGLIHEYWAPNFWALYHFFDKIMFACIMKFPALYSKFEGVIISHPSDHSSVNVLKVLPNIPPGITITIILCLLIPIMIKTFLKTKNSAQKNAICFPSLISICGFIFFMFGFHVHEKAITPYLCLILMFVENTKFLGIAIFVNIANLTPLMIQSDEKVLCLALAALWPALWDSYSNNSNNKQFYLESGNLSQTSHFSLLFELFSMRQLFQDFVQLSGWAILLNYCIFQHYFSSQHLQFLPIMLNSVWAAAFNTFWTTLLYFKYLKSGTLNSKIAQQTV